MASNRRPNQKFIRDDEFERFVTETLESQDRMLEKLEKKLEKPVMNGGFDTLVTKVDKIELVTGQLQESHSEVSQKINAIHTVVMDPDTGLYHKVKSNSQWIDSARRGLKWLLGFMAAGVLTGTGKLLYDFFSGHVHFTP